MKKGYDFRLAYREELEQPNNKYKWLDIDRSLRWLSMAISKQVIKHTSLTPNTITIMSFAAALAGGYFLLLGTYATFVIGGLLSLLRQILDQVDGEVARVKGPSTVLGKWLDGITGFISIEWLIFCLALGLNSDKALILGILAAMAFPMQYLLVFYFKFEIVKETKPLQIGKGGRWEFLRKMYGSTLFHILLLIGVVLNKALWVLAFFAIVGNLYWVGTLVVEFTNLRRSQQKS